MCDIKWEDVFEEHIHRPPGAKDWEIDEFVATVQQPLSSGDIEGQRDHAEKYPERWIIPTGPLPPAYLSLLRWSNG